MTFFTRRSSSKSLKTKCARRQKMKTMWIHCSQLLLCYKNECGIACCLDFRNRIEFESLSFFLHPQTTTAALRSCRYSALPSKPSHRAIFSRNPSLLFTIHILIFDGGWFPLKKYSSLNAGLSGGWVLVPFSCSL